MAKRQTGAGNYGWKGGKRMHKSGYRYLLLPDDDPQRGMGGRAEHPRTIAFAILNGSFTMLVTRVPFEPANPLRPPTLRSLRAGSDLPAC